MRDDPKAEVGTGSRGVGIGGHLRAYPRLKGPPGLKAGAPGSSPDNPILPPDGTQGLLTLCYGENGWVLIPNPQAGMPIA
jgi:hypothetical protein